MQTKKIQIPVGPDETVSAVMGGPENAVSRGLTGLIFAHGAGNDMHHPLIVFASESLADNGFVTLRFNFPYTEKGRKAPDSQQKLVNTWLNVHDYFKNKSGYSLSRIIPVGKSMGGRVASQMVADGLMGVDSLIFLGYPLHAPGKKDQLRDAHLYKIKIPMLFFAGTRDTLCDLEKLNGVLAKLNCKWELEIIQGGDHSFKLPKSANRSETDVYRQIFDKSIKWLSS